MGIVRVILSSPASLISAGELANTAPLSVVPSRICTVACEVPGAGSLRAHEERNKTARNIANRPIMQASIQPWKNQFMEEIRIRPANVDDMRHILHQRRAMFSEMGCNDEVLLDRMQEASEKYLLDAMPRGIYRAWIAESEGGLVVSGGGIA